MEAGTKKLLIYGSIGIVSVVGIIVAVNVIKKAVKRHRADVDKPKDQDKEIPFDPTKQYKMVLLGSQKFVNVRTSTAVPEKMNYLDWLITPWEVVTIDSNLIGKVETNPVGYVQEEQKGKDGYMWYYIRLEKKLNDKTHGWVREDAVKVVIKNRA